RARARRLGVDRRPRAQRGGGRGHRPRRPAPPRAWPDRRAPGPAAPPPPALTQRVRGDGGRRGHPGLTGVARGADGPGVTHVPAWRPDPAEESTFRLAITCLKVLS